MFTKIFIKRYNKLMSLFLIIFTLYLVFMNFYILHLGERFAEDYNAASYEITYTKTIDRALEDGTEYVGLPTRFVYLDDDGNNLIKTDNLIRAYHKLNKDVLNLENTSSYTGSIFFVLSAFGLIITARNRFSVTGYVVATILTLVITLKIGIISFLAIPITLTLLLSSILIYFTKFVDWNENIFLTFGK